MQINPVVSRLASASVYLFAIGVAIYAITAPVMKLDEYTSVYYLDKYCFNNKCEAHSTIFKPYYDALYALYITFIILAGLCFILLLTNQRKLYSLIGLLLLAVSIGTMIFLIRIIKTTTWSGSTPYEFTSASILMVIAFCFMIVKQLFSNDIIRGLLQKIIH